MSDTLQADYLVIGSGAVGMAFADTVFHESASTLLIVDRHHGPGGHWNDAYPFVRLHQPSSFYGVNSRPLGQDDGRDHHRLNRGMTERATGAEIVSYYERLMVDMVASGRVRHCPMTEVTGGTQQHGETVSLRSLLSGQTTVAHARRRVVDTTWLNTAVPSTHPPRYAVADGVRCVPLNALTQVREPPEGFVVVGAGKTGIDACIWLLDNGVRPDRIRWIMPRDSWFQNRANIQAGDDFFMPTFTAMAMQFEAVAAAESVEDLFRRLEATKQLLRLDPQVQPGMYHAAVVSEAELQELRGIRDVVRLGRVQRIDRDRIVLDRGEVPMNPAWLVVDCSASAAEPRPARPVFDGRLITPQFIQAFQPTFSAALIAHVELMTLDDEQRNILCKPVPLPDTPITWLTMQAASMANRYRWNRNADIAQWIIASRLDGFTKMMDRVQDDEADKVAVMHRLGAAVPAAAARLKTLLTA